MKLELTDQEANAVLEMASTSLGVHKIHALDAVNMIVNKIKAAKLQEQNEKTPPLAAVPNSGAAGQG